MIVSKQIKREAKQVLRLCMVDGLLDERRVDRVVQHFSAATYRHCPILLKCFLRLVKLERNRRSARIESATPLSAELQAATLANLTRRYGPGLSAAFTHRASLIGGMRIQVGSDLYDGSVLARLRALEKSF
jgi:F-type H+-transporting ATPase subunit delta